MNLNRKKRFVSITWQIFSRIFLSLAKFSFTFSRFFIPIPYIHTYSCKKCSLIFVGKILNKIQITTTEIFDPSLNTANISDTKTLHIYTYRPTTTTHYRQVASTPTIYMHTLHYRTRNVQRLNMVVVIKSDLFHLSVCLRCDTDIFNGSSNKSFLSDSNFVGTREGNTLSAKKIVGLKISRLNF